MEIINIGEEVICDFCNSSGEDSHGGSWSGVMQYVVSVAKKTDTINLTMNTKATLLSFFQRIKPLKKMS